MRLYTNFNPVHRSLINELFSNLMAEESQADASCGCVPANIEETENEYHVELSVPGFLKEQFSISVENNILVIRAGKKEEEKRNYISKEFGISSFERRFILPKHVDSEKISATVENGILSLNIPRREEVKKSMEIAVR